MGINTNNPSTYTLYVNGTSYFSDTISTASHGTSANWSDAYGWGDHSAAGYATVAGKLAQFAPITSAELASALSDEVGYSTGAKVVFNIDPIFYNNIYLKATNGTNSPAIVIQKESIDASHVAWLINHRSNNADLLHYGTDGTTTWDVIFHDWDLKETSFYGASGFIGLKISSGAQYLYSNNAQRLATQSNGVAVKGILIMSDVSSDDSYFYMREKSTDASTPSSGYSALYAKSDGKIYYRNSSGTIYDLTLGGVGGGGITSVSAGNGMSFTTITTSGAVTLGTPSSITGTSTNSVSSETHTHELSTVPVTKGGTNLTTVASGSILAANSVNTLSAITSTSGTKILKNISGTISWETETSGVTITNDILYWDGDSYTPWSSGSKDSGRLYLVGGTVPSNTAVSLGYDGKFYATEIYEGSLRVATRDYFETASTAGTTKTDWEAENTHTATQAAIAAYVETNSGDPLWFDDGLYITPTDVTHAVMIGTTSYNSNYKLLVGGGIYGTNAYLTTGLILYGLKTTTGTKMLTIDSGGNVGSADIPTGGGTGNITLNNNTNNNLVTMTGSADSLNGESNLTFDGTTLALTGAQTISTSLTAGTDLIFSNTNAATYRMIYTEDATVGSAGKNLILHAGNSDTTAGVVYMYGGWDSGSSEMGDTVLGWNGLTGGSMKYGDVYIGPYAAHYSSVTDAGVRLETIYAYKIQNTDGSVTSAEFNTGTGGVVLYHNNINRFETTSAGISVTGSVTATGKIISGSDGEFFQTVSDAKFKDEVTDLSNGLELLRMSKPRRFQWNHGPRKGQYDIGFIAQEMGLIIPEMVQYREDGNLGLYYDHYTAILASAGIEMDQTLTEHEKRIIALENETMQLKDRIKELEGLIHE